MMQIHVWHYPTGGWFITAVPTSDGCPTEKVIVISGERRTDSQAQLMYQGELDMGELVPMFARMLGADAIAFIGRAEVQMGEPGELCQCPDCRADRQSNLEVV